MRATKFALAVLLLAVLPGLAGAAALVVSLVQLSSPVAPFSDAMISVKTLPAASCTIAVLYKSGPSRAKGLGAKMADGSGVVEWRWRVGSSTTPGQWPVVVTCERGSDRGELRTMFEVR
jgi:micrococcal nuclease